MPVENKKYTKFKYSSEVISDLYKNTEYLNGFDLKKHKMIIAGGCLSTLITNNCLRYGQDIDIFAFGTDQEIKCNIYCLFAHLVSLVMKPSKNYLGDSINIYQTVRAITFKFSAHRNPIQIIKRVYNDIIDVLNHFDHSGVHFAYDGTDLYTTNVGQYAATQRIILPILNKRNDSTIYDSRIVKAINKNEYHIIVNHVKQLKGDVLSLDNLIFENLVLQQDNRYSFCNIQTMNPGPSSGYDDQSLYQMDPEDVSKYNMKKYVEGKYDQLCSIIECNSTTMFEIYQIESQLGFAGTFKHIFEDFKYINLHIQYKQRYSEIFSWDFLLTEKEKIEMLKKNIKNIFIDNRGSAIKVDPEEIINKILIITEEIYKSLANAEVMNKFQLFREDNVFFNNWGGAVPSMKANGLVSNNFSSLVRLIGLGRVLYHMSKIFWIFFSYEADI